MNINAKLIRKQPSVKTDYCIVEDIIELNESEYATLYQNLLADRDYITERIGLMKHDSKTDTEHCILILGVGQADGILVQSNGCDSPIYSAFISQARAIVKSHIKQLADYCISEGTMHSENGRWSNSYEELYNHFGANISDTNGNGRLLKEELQRRAEVAELIMTEDCIEIAYHLEYCENCQEGGIEGTTDLMSLVGCNIYDEHEKSSEDEVPNAVQTM